MKKVFTILLLLSINSCKAQGNQKVADYYIYAQLDNKLLKTTYKNTIKIVFKCGCYAKKYDLEFICNDTLKNFNRDSIPSKIYSMSEFANIASDKRAKSKNLQLWNSIIYIVEKKGKNFHYISVKFYPIENEE